MTIVRTIIYKGGLENNYEPYHQDTTTLSMEDWIIQHNEDRGADINDKDCLLPETSALWEDESQFIVHETEI
tara:strand:- start:162 stop:377 length:216 start_codon:yes stop_codon:yes gene_type:complete